VANVFIMSILFVVAVPRTVPGSSWARTAIRGGLARPSSGERYRFQRGAGPEL